MRDRNPRLRQQPTDKHLINDRITASEVLVVADGGEQLGVLTKEKALSIAEERSLDLVLVSPDSNPPVCRLLDYGKLKYKERKKAAEARKKTSNQTIKELRVRYSTDTHDLDTKVKKAIKFLEGGDRVKFLMRFRGREIVYRDLGEEIFDKIVEMLSEVSEVENRAPLTGNSMAITFAPKG